MTTDLLTFFHPGESAGMAWTFPVRFGSAPPIEIWVFTPGRADLSQFAAATVSSEESYKRLLEELHSMLQQSGGILIRAQAHNDVVRTKLTRVETEGYTAPRSLLRLSAVGDPRFEEISDLIDLKLGEHLIVPVCAAAEAKLHALREDLKGLPTDLESSVLNVLRRPSLEWRLDRIERVLSLPPATQSEWQRSQIRKETFLQKLGRLFMWRIPAGPVAAALLLVAGSVAAYDKLSGADVHREQEKESADLAPAGSPDPEATASPKASESESGDEEDVLEEPLGDLFSALQATSDQDITTLFTSHFAGHEKDFFSSASPGIWGIAKLQALKWQLLQTGEGTLSNVKLQARVKEIYANDSNKRLEQDKSAARLLAWGFCQQPSAKAEMPKTATEPKEALTLLRDKDCDDLKPEDAVAGLEDLTAWVKQQAPSGTAK